ncbi:major facilitator superfamily MFS_1 [Pseudopedobacter saltans DSM 12145]|uniref:Major facilitator superfamily MFS_1 n=1 Tax=Pseudopedobacter saltans (strain ATCC 51119 / DSM 12145 / JCM 21818 / CCUG 39354 / LMG 10337 / NBRC 100064 / NCIMB 13643) TaxID=762903 RepID=F0S8A0_PSESL|nr:MFS transporter [Pseudopedobacter saltans]ADY52362.1 major facilitator superfamily MFS_1 [Pseudopedobacter saltans DSM 12145]
MYRSKFLVLIILLIWFVISFVTNIMGPLMPIVIETYQLSLTMAAFLPFSFFLAYGIASIPSGALIERVGEKRAMLIAFCLNLIGSLAIAVYPVYAMALFSLFTIGIGMAMLQVIINPLMRTVGGEDNYAFYSVLAQLIFGLGSFVSPFVFTYLTSSQFVNNQEKGFIVFLNSLVNHNQQWTILYWLFGVIFIAVFILISSIYIPKVELKEDEKGGTIDTYFELIKDKKVILFFIGIVAYVGTEQSLANWMSEFLKQYHGFDALTKGAEAVAWFWGLMSIGCLLGLLLLKILDSKIVLKGAALFTLAAITVALFGSSQLSYYAFMFSGFTISVMFSIIFSLALNSVSQHHGSFSGILCTGIFGGALLPLLVGALGDIIGLRYALMVLYISVGYIMYLAFYAKPLISNKTILSKKQS